MPQGGRAVVGAQKSRTAHSPLDTNRPDREIRGRIIGTDTRKFFRLFSLGINLIEPSVSLRMPISDFPNCGIFGPILVVSGPVGRGALRMTP